MRSGFLLIEPADYVEAVGLANRHGYDAISQNTFARDNATLRDVNGCALDLMQPRSYKMCTARQNASVVESFEYV